MERVNVEMSALTRPMRLNSNSVTDAITTPARIAMATQHVAKKTQGVSKFKYLIAPALTESSRSRSREVERELQKHTQAPPLFSFDSTARELCTSELHRRHHQTHR